MRWLEAGKAVLKASIGWVQLVGGDVDKHEEKGVRIAVVQSRTEQEEIMDQSGRKEPYIFEPTNPSGPQKLLPTTEDNNSALIIEFMHKNKEQLRLDQKPVWD